MNADTQEIARRTTVALAAIKRAFEGNDDSSVAFFASHHIEELDEAYWKKHAGTPRPSSTQVVDLLELSSHWGDEDDDGMEVFDFTLPGGVTNYVVSVRFDESGAVESIEMES